MGTHATPSEELLAAWQPPATVRLLLSPDGTLHDAPHPAGDPFQLSDVDVPLLEALSLAVCTRCRFEPVAEARQHAEVLNAALKLVSPPTDLTWADVRSLYVASIAPGSVLPLSTPPYPAARAVMGVLARTSRTLATRYASHLGSYDLHLAIAIQAVSFSATPAAATRLQSFATTALLLRGFSTDPGRTPARDADFSAWFAHAQACLAASPPTSGILAAVPPRPPAGSGEAEVVELLCFAHQAPPAFAYLTLPKLVWDGLAALGATVCCWDLEHFDQATRSRVLDTASKLWDPTPAAPLNDLAAVLTIASDATV